MASHKLFGVFRNLTKFGLVLAFVVILLGAYTRLSDAGLGCPDWPGCYGNLLVPETEELINQANAAYPERPVETGKAWKEMVHRYFAGSLGLVILALAVLAFKNRRYVRQPVLLPIALLALVIFQALLGMWTVTLKVMPVVVMAHLIGGFSTLALLWWTLISTRDWDISRTLNSGLRGLGILAVVLLLFQIMLGGWTSSNYAALACPDFPMCQEKWWPTMDFAEGFVLWRGIGIDYEFGVLDGAARTAIHMAHRLGAVVVGLYLILFSVGVLKSVSSGPVKTTAISVLLLVLIQIALGISNVVFGLPLEVAVIHNGTAAVLLLALLTLVYLLFRGQGNDLRFGVSP